MASSVAKDIDDKQKEQNYVRLNLVVVKLSTRVIKARFDLTVPPGPQLHQEINKFTKKINNGRSKKLISQKQYDLLFPKSGPPSSEKFDITLLVYLLKHICGLDGKCKWWAEKDNKNIPETEVGEIADIVRIRNVRNEINHLQTAIMDQKDFKEKWDITEKAMLRLGAVCNLSDLKNEIDTIKNQPFEKIKEKVIVMKSQGFDGNYGYSDDDEEIYDDNYDYYDPYDDDTEEYEHDDYNDYHEYDQDYDDDVHDWNDYDDDVNDNQDDQYDDVHDYQDDQYDDYDE